MKGKERRGGKRGEAQKECNGRKKEERKRERIKKPKEIYAQ